MGSSCESGAPVVNPVTARSPAHAPPLILAGVPVLVAVGVLLPLGVLVWRAFEPGIGAGDGSGLWDDLWRGQNGWRLLNTLGLAAAVSASTLALGLPAAWLTVRSDLRGRRAWAVLLTLPLAVPGYLLAYAILAVGGRYGMAAHLTGWEAPRVRGFLGAWGALTLCNTPYVLLTLRAGLRRVDPSLEEAARALGHGRVRSFITATLPQLRPAIAAGGLLVALHAVSDFGVVSLMGFETFSYALYDQFRGYDRAGAAWMALAMLALAGALITGEWLAAGSASLHRAGRGEAQSRRRITLGPWQAPAAAYLLVLFTASVAAPAAVVGYWAWQADWGTAWSGVLRSTLDSVWVAAPAAVAATLLALPAAVLAARYPSRRSRILERMGYLGYATPGLALGLALVVLSVWLPDAVEASAGWVASEDIARAAGDAVYGVLGPSVLLLVIGYALHFVGEAAGPVRASLATASPRLEEASRSLGAGRVRTFVRVTLPLMWPGVAASLALVFLSVLKELPLALMLRPPGFEPLSYNLWLYSSDPLTFAQAGPYAVAILVLSGVFVAALVMGEGRRI